MNAPFTLRARPANNLARSFITGLYRETLRTAAQFSVIGEFSKIVYLLRPQTQVLQE